MPEGKRGEFGYGDVWTWTAICADTKLVPSYRVGSRDSATAHDFIHDLASRLRNRVQLTRDQYTLYTGAVGSAFEGDVDYAQLFKTYGEDPEPQRRYSPAKCLSISARRVSGDPDPEHISTSYVERQNLTMRMSMRRFTRLTNAFSKKVENLTAAVSLHFMHYNYCRPHQSLEGKTTPAMAAGLTDHVWKISEVI
ncbi:MAG: hypothetical protein QOF08_2042, partial [Gaiellales bacterium]|nr:hypothetical protein [Gaiellales bacterium]